MEFSAYAAKETSALIERVVTESSQASLQRVETLRTALDAASKALEAALTATPDTTTEVTELVARLTKAATTDGDARLKRLSSEARKITETLRADLEEQTKAKEELAATRLQRREPAALEPHAGEPGALGDDGRDAQGEPAVRHQRQHDAPGQDRGGRPGVQQDPEPPRDR